VNCNSVAASANFSCSDAWGDGHVINWRHNLHHQITCPVTSSSISGISCYTNELHDLYCTVNNAQINFAKMKKVPNPKSEVPTRQFEQDFLSIDCNKASNEQQALRQDFAFTHLFSFQPGSNHCDHYINGTTLLYSHDNIRNFGHTYNDILNVWLMLYIEDYMLFTNDLHLVSVDAMRLYNNFDDRVNDLLTIYKKSFKQIHRGLDFGSKVVCFERLLLQPLPSRGFVWNNWHQVIT
jgi:hypothetical protein